MQPVQLRAAKREEIPACVARWWATARAADADVRGVEDEMHVVSTRRGTVHGSMAPVGVTAAQLCSRQCALVFLVLWEEARGLVVVVGFVHVPLLRARHATHARCDSCAMVQSDFAACCFDASKAARFSAASYPAVVHVRARPDTLHDVDCSVDGLVRLAGWRLRAAERFAAHCADVNTALAHVGALLQQEGVGLLTAEERRRDAASFRLCVAIAAYDARLAAGMWLFEWLLQLHKLTTLARTPDEALQALALNGVAYASAGTETHAVPFSELGWHDATALPLRAQLPLGAALRAGLYPLSRGMAHVPSAAMPSLACGSVLAVLERAWRAPRAGAVVEMLSRVTLQRVRDDALAPARGTLSAWNLALASRTNSSRTPLGGERDAARAPAAYGVPEWNPAEQEDDDDVHEATRAERVPPTTDAQYWARIVRQMPACMRALFCPDARRAQPGKPLLPYASRMTLLAFLANMATTFCGYMTLWHAVCLPLHESGARECEARDFATCTKQKAYGREALDVWRKRLKNKLCSTINREGCCPYGADGVRCLQDIEDATGYLRGRACKGPRSYRWLEYVARSHGAPAQHTEEAEAKRQCIVLSVI